MYFWLNSQNQLRYSILKDSRSGGTQKTGNLSYDKTRNQKSTGILSFDKMWASLPYTTHTPRPEDYQMIKLACQAQLPIYHLIKVASLEDLRQFQAMHGSQSSSVQFRGMCQVLKAEEYGNWCGFNVILLNVSRPMHANEKNRLHSAVVMVLHETPSWTECPNVQPFI